MTPHAHTTRTTTTSKNNNTTMTTSEEVAKQDTQNMEHLGDWDHGVEPDAGGEPKNQDKKKVPLVKQAQAAVGAAVHSIEAAASKIKENLKEGVDDQHTEEEVMGMKMCVSKTVRQDSFIAPC
jgi:hypothetical protein